MILLNTIKYWSRLFHGYLTNLYSHIGDHQQITFITLSRFCRLSKLPLFLKLDEILTKFKWNKFICLFHIVFQILKVIFIRCYKIQPLVRLYLVVLHQLLHQKFIQHYQKNDFRHKFLWIFMDSPKLPHSIDKWS